MSAEIKTLKFYEGLAVSPPDQNQPVTVGPAVNANHAIQKSQAEAYADAIGALKVSKAGDTMTGALAMSTNKITGLGNGTVATDAVNKGQMDAGDALAESNAITASNAYTDAEILALINSAPATLDTLKELADALGSDPNFSTTVATALGNRLRVDTNAQGLTGTEKTNAKTNIDLQNVDNTSDAQKNSAVATLTNKTLDRVVTQETADAVTTGANAHINNTLTSIYKVTNAGLLSISTLEPVNGMFFVLTNKTGASILINNKNGTANKQIDTGTGANISLADGASLFLYYSPTSLIWQVVGGTGSGGGVSDKSLALKWNKSGNLSPVQSFVDGMSIEDFSNEESQEIYATFEVPSSFLGGSQILLKGLSFFTSLIAGNVLFKAQATLIKAGSTVIGTYTNQRTTTNAQVAVAGVANRVTSIGDLDLTDLTGQINGVAVAGGDTIRVRLYRDIASETSGLADVARLLIESCEVKI